MEKLNVTTVTSQKPESDFIMDENESILPCVENFYKFCAQGKLMGVKCVSCGNVISPPRVICPKCFASKFEWMELRGRGRLLTYTIIHFPPSQFQALAPYAVGILKLEEGPQLPGMIKNLKLEELRIGMDLQVGFETAVPKEWPRWARYFFKPVG